MMIAALLASTWLEKLGLNEFTISEIANPHVAAAAIGAAAFSIVALHRDRPCEKTAAIFGVFAFGWTVALVLAWAKPEVGTLADFWCWIPPAVAGTAALRFIDLIPKLSIVFRWLVRFAVVQLFAVLIVPKGEGWEDWSTYYGWWILGISQLTLVNWAVVEFVAQRRERFATWPLVAVLGVAALVVGQTFASLKDVCVIGGAALGVIALALTIRPSKQLLSSVAAGFSMLVCSTLGVCNFYDNYGMPLVCFFAVMCAPVGLLLGELSPNRSWLRIILQMTGVSIPLIIAVMRLMAFVAAGENW